MAVEIFETRFSRSRRHCQLLFSSRRPSYYCFDRSAYQGSCCSNWHRTGKCASSREPSRYSRRAGDPLSFQNLLHVRRGTRDYPAHQTYVTTPLGRGAVELRAPTCMPRLQRRVHNMTTPLPPGDEFQPTSGLARLARANIQECGSLVDSTLSPRRKPASLHASGTRIYKPAKHCHPRGGAD